MEDISKGKFSIYLFNAYSCLDPEKDFISGSDRVGIKLIEMEKESVIVIGPSVFKKQLPNNVTFFSSDDFKFKNLFLRYIYRAFTTFFIINNLLKKRHKNTIKTKIISTSDFFPDTIPAFLFAKVLCWYSFTYHLYPFNFKIRNFLGRILQVFSYLLLKRSKKIITTSSECENFLKKNFHYSNILKIPLGIDYNNYPNNQEKNNDLVYLGRIKKSKGVFDLPEIIKNVVKEFPKIKLFIIGNGEEVDLKKIKQQVKTYKLNKNIIILNNLKDEEVKNYLSSSKILLQPSYEEGFGLSVLEALVSNMKVVAYNLPVYQEHFSDFDIDYVAIGDKINFSLKIKEILNNKNKLIYQKNLFLKFSWGKIFDKIFIDKHI